VDPPPSSNVHRAAVLPVRRTGRSRPGPGYRDMPSMMPFIVALGRIAAEVSAESGW